MRRAAAGEVAGDGDETGDREMRRGGGSGGELSLVETKASG